MSYTFKQLFDEWSEIYIPTKDERKKMRETHEIAKGKLGLSNSMGLLAAFQKFKPLWNKQYSSLKKMDFQKVINQTIGKKTKLVDMRNLIVKLDKYALGEDIISRGYGKLLDIEYDVSTSTRTPFTYEAIEKIWKHESNLIADILLILLHTGMRIEELLIIKNENIDLSKKYLVGGIKTKAGKDRLIPIHHSIFPIIKRYYDTTNTYLFTIGEKRLYYEKYLKSYKAFMEELDLNYTTHETRYTFRSELDRLGANTRCIDLIMGHESGNTGNRVYNQKTIEELKATVELLNYRQKKGKKITYFKVV